jgi:hypothetical protein
LRAGLLSDPEVIHHLNQRFVSTAIIIDDAQKCAANGNELARQLADQWEYPLEMIFLTSDGRVVSKLNSFKDFPGVHPDVVAPPRQKHLAREDEHSHRDLFLKHLAQHFGG